MSWDVVLVNLSNSVDMLANADGRWGSKAYMLPLHSAGELQTTLSDLFPDMRFEAPSSWGTWGYLRGDGYTVQFNIGDISDRKSITLNVRGWNGAGVLNNILRPLCERTGWTAFDIGDGKRIDFSAPVPAPGFYRWRQQRDQMIAALHPQISRSIQNTVRGIKF